MPARKKTRKRLDIPRPHNSGRWTRNDLINFIKSALRRASVRWEPKNEAIRKACVGDGINPRTGRKCKLHQCPQCGELFPRSEIRADHVVPVVGPEGFTTWDSFIERLFCEADGFSAICDGCHKRITEHERKLRAAHSSKPPGADELL